MSLDNLRFDGERLADVLAAERKQDLDSFPRPYEGYRRPSVNTLAKVDRLDGTQVYLRYTEAAYEADGKIPAGIYCWTEAWYPRPLCEGQDEGARVYNYVTSTKVKVGDLPPLDAEAPESVQ